MGSGASNAEGLPPEEVDDLRLSLHAAAEAGDTTTVARLLDLGADTEVENEDGDTPLHVAASKDVVKLLLQAKADSDAPNCKGFSMLHLATKRSDKDLVEELLSHRADVNLGQALTVELRRQSGQTLGLEWDRWHHEKQRRILSRVVPDSPAGRWNQERGASGHEILQEGYELIKVNGQSSRQALSNLKQLDEVKLVFRNSKLLTVELKREKGETFGFRWDSQQDRNRRRVLEEVLPDSPAWQCNLERKASGREMLQKGFELLEVNGQSGWEACSKLRSLEQVQLLFRNPKAICLSALHVAARSGFADIAEVLLEAKADPSQVDEHGKTARDVAEGRVVVGVLERGVQLQAGCVEAMPKAFDPLALHHAAAAGDASAVELLLHQGFEANAKNQDGSGVLHIAASREVVRLLLSAKADCNAADSRGDSLLHLSAKVGNKDVVDELLVAKADVNIGLPLTVQLKRASGQAWGLQWDQQLFQQQRRILMGVLRDSPAWEWNCTRIAEHRETLREGCELIEVNGESGWAAMSSIANLQRAELVFRGLQPDCDTPLHVAASNGQKDIANCLLAAAADPRVRNGAGKSALEIFTEGAHILLELATQKGITGFMFVSMNETWKDVKRCFQMHFAKLITTSSHVTVISQGKELHNMSMVREHFADQMTSQLFVSMLARESLLLLTKEGHIDRVADLLHGSADLTFIV